METCEKEDIYALPHDDDGDVCDDEICALEEDICEVEEETLLASEEICKKGENIWAREEICAPEGGIRRAWEGISKLDTVDSKQRHSYMRGGI